MPRLRTVVRRGSVVTAVSSMPQIKFAYSNFYAYLCIK